MPPFGEDGERIRGRDNREAAERALARIRLFGEADGPPIDERWLVARICSEYLQRCDRRVKAGAMTRNVIVVMTWIVATIFMVQDSRRGP